MLLYPDFTQTWLGSSIFAQATKVRYGQTLSALQAAHPRREMHQFTTDHLVKHLTRPLEAGGDRAPKSILAERNAIRSCFNAARRRGVILVDPAIDLIEEVNPVARNVTKGRWLSKEEARILLDSCPDTDIGVRDRTLIHMALLTGLRRTSMSQLTWGMVDLGGLHINVLTKNRKPMTIGINPQLALVLEKWRLRYEHGLDRPVRHSDPVICQGYWDGIGTKDHVIVWGLSISGDGIYQIIRRRAKAVGIKMATHDTRRTFNGFLKEDGVPLEDRAAAMGHSSVDTTSRVYDKEDPRQAIRAVSGLEI